MKVHEYQAKELLKNAGVAVPEGIVVTRPEEAAKAYDALGGGLIVVKAQVHAGGRGKGVAIGPDDDRDRGARDRQRAQAAARVDGQGRAARQVGPGGAEGRRQPARQDAGDLPDRCRRASPISKVLVTVGHDIARELYLGMAVDRGLQCPVLMASTEGGVEIETVAHKTPEKILREPIDVGLGLADFQARKICKALGLSGDSAKKGATFLKNFVQLFIDTDASLAEINPLIVTASGRRAGPRLQAELRRQRPVPPPRHRRAARRGRGRPGRAAGRARAA